MAAPDRIDHLEKIFALSEDLEKRGMVPVMVGGIALVILGSQRVTKDFDFLVSLKDLPVDEMVSVFYDHGFELVTKFNKEGEVVRTVDNPRVAALKLRSDLPDSLFFFNWGTRLKVDLLLDFPLPAREIAVRSDKVKIKGHSIRVASQSDLIRLKEIAYADRKSASDAQDLEFLKRLSRKRRT